MSKLRSVNTSIWSDTWFETLPPKQKLLFIYFITNEKTNMLGVYEISLRKVAFETGLQIAEVDQYLNEFLQAGKIRYAENRVILMNYIKHQKYNPNMKVSAVDCYNELPDSLKIDGINELERDAKGFERLCKGFGTVPKVEIEIEKEIEDKTEYENESGSGSDVLEVEVKPDSTRNIQPDLKTFLEYAKIAAARCDIELDESKAKARYYAWSENGWRDSRGNDIGNWKSKLSAALTDFKDTSPQSKEDEMPKFDSRLLMRKGR